MPKVRFAAESALSGDNPGVTSQRLVNCYPCPTSPGARSPFVLRSVLGYSETPRADLGNRIVRAAIGGPDYLYIVASGLVYSISSDYTATIVGGVIDDPETLLSRTREGVSLASAGLYYVWNGGSFSQISGGAFSQVGSTAFLDQYTILSEKDGRKVEWTELGDPATRNALNVRTKEARPDSVIRVVSSQGRLFVMGEESTEIWYNTGAAGALAFDRIQGAVVDVGLKAKRLCIEYEGGIFFIGDDDIFYRISGGLPEPLSTSAVGRSLSDETPTNVFAYEDRGHKFLCIRFDARPAWCYDLATRAWHERSTGVELGPWEVVNTVKAFGEWTAITSNGLVYRLSRANKDGAVPMRRSMVSLPLDADGEIVSVSALEFRIQAGLSDVDATPSLAGTSREASATLRVSRDGGASFGGEKKASFGKLGQYGRRARFRGLGAARHFTVELSVSDPNELPVESDALLEAS